MPVIRLFGADSLGHKCCLHVHNVIILTRLLWIDSSLFNYDLSAFFEIFFVFILLVSALLLH